MDRRSALEKMSKDQKVLKLKELDQRLYLIESLFPRGFLKYEWSDDRKGPNCATWEQIDEVYHSEHSEDSLITRHVEGCGVCLYKLLCLERTHVLEDIGLIVDGDELPIDDTYSIVN